MTFAAIRIESQPVPRSGPERRMTNQLVNYWYELRGAHAVPLITNFSVEAVPKFGPHSFLLDLAGGIADAVIRYVGQALCKDCNGDLTQKRVSAVPPTSLLAYAVDRRLKVVATKRPVSFEGQYVDEQGMERLYRGILLPLSNDGSNVHFIVGSINSREGLPAQKSSQPTFAAAPVEPKPDMVWDAPVEGAAEAPAAEELAAAPVAEELVAAPAAEVDPPPASARLSASLRQCRALARKVVGADARSHRALYEALEGVYALHFECQDDPAGHARLLAAAKLKKQTRAPFTPLIKLVFGADCGKSRLSEYAAALSFALRCDQPVGAIVQFLDAQPGGLKECVKAERAARRKDVGRAPATATPVEDALRGLPPIGKATDPGPGSDEFVLLLGRRTGDGIGTVNVLRVLDEPPTAVRSVIRRLAKALPVEEPPSGEGNSAAS